jgi:adenylate kinase
MALYDSMGKVLLLSGAPGTGKSTLRKSLEPSIAGLQQFDYEELLRRQKAKQGSVVTYEQLRDQSASVISPQDVADTRKLLLDNRRIADNPGRCRD